MEAFARIVLFICWVVQVQVPPRDPHSPEQFFLRAMMRYAEGEVDDAIEDLSHAIELNSGFKRSVPSGQNGPRFNSIPSDEVPGRIVVMDKFNAAAYYNRGRLHLEKGELDKALADLDIAIKLNPQNAPAYDCRGTTLQEKGLLEPAIRDFNKAIELYPAFAGAYLNRGNAHFEKTELPDAIADYTRAVAIDPRMAIAFKNRGNARTATGEYDLALRDYGRALELDPQLCLALAGRGLVFLLQGRQAEADEDFNRCLRLSAGMAGKIEQIKKYASEKVRAR